MADTMCRLADIDGVVYAERVPGFWVEVLGQEGFAACSTDTKVFLVQSALKDRPDFEWSPTPEQLL